MGEHSIGEGEAPKRDECLERKVPARPVRTFVDIPQTVEHGEQPAVF